MINWYSCKDFTILNVKVKVKIPVSLAIIVLFKAKVGANFKVFNCPSSFEVPWKVNEDI